MDDFSITDDRLTGALHNLRLANRWLGGYASLTGALKPLFSDISRPLRLLDVGTGLGDVPLFLFAWARQQGIRLEAVGIDANPVTVQRASSFLDAQLAPQNRAMVQVVPADAFALPYPDDSFDVVTAMQFLHHFDAAAVVTLLREMQRVARWGIVISDLHRHPFAYYGLKALVAMLPVSPMYKHDGPISVLRGFTRQELVHYARQAHLPNVHIRWHWAFRWSLRSFHQVPV